MKNIHKSLHTATLITSLVLTGACHDARGDAEKDQHASHTPGEVGVQTTGAWLLGSEVQSNANDLDLGQAQKGLSYTIPASTMISDGVETYAETFGWSIRWTARDDYRLDAPFPIPGGMTLQDGIRYVLRSYQSQGGLIGATPEFHDVNKVVVIHQSSVERK